MDEAVTWALNSSGYSGQFLKVLRSDGAGFYGNHGIPIRHQHRSSRDAARPANQGTPNVLLGHIDTHITPHYYRCLNKLTGTPERDKAIERLQLALMELIEGAPLDEWFSGKNNPGIIDFALAPFALRMSLLYPHFKSFSLPTSGRGWEPYANWEARITALPAFKFTAPVPETYKARLLRYYAIVAIGKSHQEAAKIAVD